MTEANPPAQPEELRRRILFLLQEKDRQGDYRHLFQIASDLEETPEDIRDQLDILKDLALQNGDARAAVEVLKAVGLYGQLPPPSGPEDAELVLWEAAKGWAELEFKKQRPSIDSTMEFALGQIEIPALAQERMEELREQFGQ